MTMDNPVRKHTLSINNRPVSFSDEPNLLAVIRRAEIEIPTFCYHSELSVYGACRLCIVEVEGRGIVTSCSIPPEAGMRVHTNTLELRETRKINIELLLASHHQACPTCVKSDTCKLLDIARRLGIEKVRFQEKPRKLPLDESGVALTRDPNKCVLCGDCVRYCREIQGVGAIDFINRGARTQVAPAFNQGIGEVECVNCGQCAAVCPTGAIIPRSAIAEVWHELHDRKKTVVVQLAPAVRVALGEAFGGEAGELTTGQAVAALKQLGFDQVFDTSFAADLTVVEEATEFLERFESGDKLPQFTSCCPAWVKFVEQYNPELLPQLSTCRSPQQMFGALARKLLPPQLGIEPENLVIISIMPCTAKKFEANRSEFKEDGRADVDHVLTTQELARMIKEAGLRFANLEPRGFDLPFGFKTGGGVIFGNSGGVTEAVLRYAHEKLTGEKRCDFEFRQVRGNQGLLTSSLTIAGKSLNIGVVHGLQNTRDLIRKIKNGTTDYHLIEVMACPGGCVSGAGQPISLEPGTRNKRTRGLYNADATMQLHKPQDNPYVQRCYDQVLQRPGGKIAHQMLHTGYQNRQPVLGHELPIRPGAPIPHKIQVEICVGTGCFLKGSRQLLEDLNNHLEQAALTDRVQVNPTFCHERCARGPMVAVNQQLLEKCDIDQATAAIATVLGETMNSQLADG